MGFGDPSIPLEALEEVEDSRIEPGGLEAGSELGHCGLMSLPPPPLPQHLEIPQDGIAGIFLLNLLQPAPLQP